MNYTLNGFTIEYFNTNGITSLTTLLMEIAIWAEKTNAYVDTLNINYIGETDCWTAYVTHTGKLVNNYDEVKVDYDLQPSIDLAQKLLAELLS